MDMTHRYCVIVTTTDSQGEAESLADMLVSDGFAACVQITPITSIYTWQGSLHKDPEWLMSIKTKASLYPQVEEALLAHHSYETPEIIQLPIVQGSASYLAWIDANTKADHET